MCRATWGARFCLSPSAAAPTSRVHKCCEGSWAQRVVLDWFSEHSAFSTLARADWFEGLPAKAYRARIYTVSTNKYGVKAGQDQVGPGRAWRLACQPQP